MVFSNAITTLDLGLIIMKAMTIGISQIWKKRNVASGKGNTMFVKAGFNIIVTTAKRIVSASVLVFIFGQL